MTFDLKIFLHAVSSISQDALHGLTGCIWKHLAQCVDLPSEREKKRKTQMILKYLHLDES